MCVFVCVCVHIYTYAYTCTYTHTYIHKNTRRVKRSKRKQATLGMAKDVSNHSGCSSSGADPVRRSNITCRAQEHGNSVRANQKRAPGKLTATHHWTSAVREPCSKSRLAFCTSAVEVARNREHLRGLTKRPHHTATTAIPRSAMRGSLIRLIIVQMQPSLVQVLLTVPVLVLPGSIMGSVPLALL